MQPDQAQFLAQTLLESAEQEARATRRTITAVPDYHWDYSPGENSRNALDLAWHMVQTELFFLNAIADGKFADEPPPMPEGISNMTEIETWYLDQQPKAVERVKALSSEDLAKAVDFFGVYNLPAVKYLQMQILHTAHHRGQLSAYIRPAGGAVPAIYGGSYDEAFELPAEVPSEPPSGLPS